MHAAQCRSGKKRTMSEFWRNLSDTDETLDAILTGYKGTVLDMPIYEDVTKFLNKNGSILDFGCGAGRNLKYLKDTYSQVYGYDFPNMLKIVPRETLAKGNVTITSDWDFISRHKYDEVLCSLVLQHIDPDELKTILARLTSCSSRFIIHSRIWVDFTFEPIMPILEQYFNIDIIEYQKDPNSEENDHFIGVFIPKEK